MDLEPAGKAKLVAGGSRGNRAVYPAQIAGLGWGIFRGALQSAFTLSCCRRSATVASKAAMR